MQSALDPTVQFPPKTYLIGAQKAGTTTLSALLDRHPAISVARPKEPDFFTGNWERGWAWYRSCFSHAPACSMLLDASTSYSMAPLSDIDGVPSRLDRVPERIAAARPDARFVYMLRDPVERAWSAYWHAVRAGWERDKFETAVRPQSLYIRGSRYSIQLSRYLSFFPAESFLCIDFREFRADTATTMARCTAFLGLGTEPIPPLSEMHLNRSFVFSGIGHTVAKILGGAQRIKQLNRAIGHRVPNKAKEVLRSILTQEVPRMSEAQRHWLRSLLEEEYGELASLTGITLR
jgi:hypothetical protein